jgi:outer membrane protein insertion porin family
LRLHLLIFMLLLLPGLAVRGQELPRAGEIRFEFETDEPAYISRASLAGVAGIRSGQALSAEAFQFAIQNLYALKIFRSVAVYTEGTSGNPTVIFRLDAFPMISGIRWVGVRSLKNRELAQAANLDRGILLTDELHDQVGRKMTDLYRARGFLDASVELRLEPGKAGRNLVVTVREGRRYRLGRADVELLEGKLLPQARARLMRLTNRFYTQALLEKEQKELKKVYQDMDYPAVRVDQFIDADPVTAGVIPIFLLETGPRLQIRVEGAKISAEEMRKTLAVYRLGDVSAFSEEICREDLSRYFKQHGEPVAAVRSTRQPLPAGEGERLVFTVEKGQTHKIPLHLAGEEAFPGRIISREADVPDEVLEGDKGAAEAIKSRVERFYQSHGYLDTAVTMRREQSGDRIRLVAEITEGPRYRLGTVTVDSGVPTSSVKLGRLEELRGRFLDSVLLEKVRAEVSDHFSSDGYIVENLDVRQEKTGDTVDIHIQPRLAGPYRLQNLVLIGRFSTRPSVLRRMMPLQEDQPLDIDGVYRAESALYASGIFENVTIDMPAVYGQRDAKNAVFKLREAPRYTFGYGFGYQEWERIRGMVEINDGNFLGRGWNAGLLFRLSQKKELVQLSFFDEKVLLGRYPLNLSLFALQEDQVSYKSRRLSIFAQTSKPLNTTSSLFLRLGFEEIKNYDLQASYNPSDLTREEEPLTLASLAATYLRDTRDNLTDPTAGGVRSASVTLAPNIFGVHTGFVNLFYQEQYYRTLVDSLVLAASFRFGSIHTFGQEGQVPISERFFAGGSNTLRGFAVDRAGPLDPVTHEPLGGNALVIGNLELRFPIYKMIQGAVFYDVGNVFSEFSKIALEDVTHSIGAGLRLKTPFGPIRLDFGYSLKDLPYDKRNQFFITIGNPF